MYTYLLVVSGIAILFKPRQELFHDRGIVKNYSLRNSFVYLGTVKIAILSPERHIGNIFTEV